MMELAGLTEIVVKSPNKFTKLNLPYDSSSDTNVNIPFGELIDSYDDLINDLVRLNPQIDPYFFQADNDGLYEDVLDILYTDNPDGATLLEFYKIYFQWLFSNLIADFNKYNGDEIDERINKFSDYVDEFADNALKGKWLNVEKVTV
jgi:hypothetical protein